MNNLKQALKPYLERIYQEKGACLYVNNCSWYEAWARRVNNDCLEKDNHPNCSFFIKYKKLRIENSCVEDID